jgi:electron transfer flavoprotein beta subunit
MKIAAVYKWATDPEATSELDKGTSDRRRATMAPGEDDPAAIAVARQIAATAGCELVGLTIGDGDASWGMARGVDRVVSVPDALNSADDAATAQLLAAAVRRIGEVDLVVIGDSSARPCVPAALAAILDWPALLGVSAVSLVNGRLHGVRGVGVRARTVSVGLPAVLAVTAVSAERAPGMKAVLAARKRPITSVSIADLEVEPNDRLEVRGTRVREAGKARIFQGSASSAARRLVDALRDRDAL